MNIPVYWSKTIVVTLLLLCAYAISVTINHIIQTVVASLLGDRTAESEGWLTLNPLEHIDPIGALLLALTNLVLVTSVPFNECFIRGPYRMAKIILFYATEPIVSMVIALMSLIVLVLGMGPDAVIPAFALFLPGTSSISLADFAQQYPAHSSLSILGSLFLMALIVYNLIITTVSVIANSMRFILVRLQDRGYLQDYSYTSLWLLTLLCIYVVSNSVYMFLFSTLVQVSSFIGNIL